MHSVRNIVISLSIVTAVIATAASPATEIAIGDRMETVIATMGTPAGEIDFGERVVYLYERGRIEFTRETVTAVNLLSDTEYAARREREQRQRRDYIQREERFQQQRIATAQRLRQAQLADADFLLSPAAEQLDFWRKLQQQFPEVSFAGEIEAIVAEIREQRIQLAREAEIRQLTERTAEAERRAAEAETVARQAQQKAAQLPLVVESGFYAPIYYQPRPPTVYHINSCPYTRQGVNSGFSYNSGRLQIRINPAH